MKMLWREIVLTLAAYSMITAGVVWLFGAVGLIACGAVLFIASFFIDVEGW